MSETETQPRNEAGQFQQSTDGLYGRELANAEAGFTTKKDPPVEEKSYSDDLAGVKQAARDLADKRRAPVEIIDLDVVKEHVGKPDATEAVTVKQAAQELATTRTNVSKYVEGSNLNNIAAEVDKARAEIIKARGPEAAQELGLSAEDIAAAKKAADGEDIADKSKRADTAIKPDDPTSTVEGLAPELEAALKHPQVRAAISEELGKAEESKQQYAAAVNYANQFAQASLVDAIPELGQLPVEQWEAAIGILAQSDPGRVQRALGIIERVARASAAQVEIDQHRAIQQRQQFVNSTEFEDARLVEALGKEAADEANKATVNFLTDHGIPRHQAFEFIQRHPLMATAAARETIWKAQQYDAMQKVRATIAAKPLPPVQRPGVVSSNRTPASEGRGRIAALQAQLEGATGPRAAKIAAAIRNIRRSS